MDVPLGEVALAQGDVMKMAECEDSLIALAPAKVNLYLEILGKRDDGFHQIETLMTAVSLYDTLEFSSTANQSLTLSVEWDVGVPLPQRTVVPVDESNLVLRALELLRKHVGEQRGAQVRLTKRIPSEAGMGGASSDAAAALMLANRAWQLHLPMSELGQLGAKVGSDVPFFLQRSPAICRGRGEEVTPLAGGRLRHFVIAKPNMGLSTAKVYQRCQIPANPRSQPSQTLFNRLEEAAFGMSTELLRLKSDFDRVGFDQHQMTGSGTAYFGIAVSTRQAIRAARRLRQFGWDRVFVARAVNGGSIRTGRKT